MSFSDPSGLIFLRILGATAAALLGALIALPGRTSHRLLCALVSFAAGGLLGVTLTHLLPETTHLIGFGPGIASIAAGLAAFYLIGRYVYALCPACNATQSEKGFFQLGILMMVAMGLHSLTDGLAIVAGAGLEGTASTGAELGLLIFIAVSYHKIPEGMALMTVLRGAGYRRPRALGITFLIEMATGLGALLGLLFLNLNPAQMGWLLGVVAGSFLYIVFFAILKEMWEHEKGPIFFYTGLGFVSIWLLEQVLSSLHFH
ncbi:MAG: ZIP family metal transporter [Armatimonadetes bacterium]|nr:ZIP family metal transporter [Armatimonadota bacterium]